jgi:histidine ammonia-lyase
MKQQTLIIGEEKISIENIYQAASLNYKIALSTNDSFVNRIKSSRNFLDEKLTKNIEVYGVTTGYGDSCTHYINKNELNQLPIMLSRYHQCGLGYFFSELEAKIISIVRIISISRGYSAVSMNLLNHMVELYNHGVYPKIPKEGSVGASGDLTPLSYYASMIIGEADVLYKGETKNSQDVLKELDIPPYVFLPKEALAIMNGTAVMTAISVIAYAKADYIANLSSKLTALSSLSLLSNSDHFHSDVFASKPHPGTIKSAEIIRSTLAEAKLIRNERIQERYSIRCAPHVIGVLFDTLSFIKPLIEIEINSSNDNPLINPVNGNLIHGGNFYGGHIALAMDTLKTSVANISDLVDRQIALIIDSKFNNGLPSNLVLNENGHLYHGLKALQISTSAWTAEALKLTMPASVFSRSTECHNQDKVSMGTIGARDCLRTIELTNQVLAASIVVTIQAIELRLKSNELLYESLGSKVQSFYEEVRKYHSYVKVDRPLDKELRELVLNINNQNSSFIGN